MADINQIITLGIGTPADIPHFILFGLNIPTLGIFDLKARKRLGNFDVDERIEHSMRSRNIALDMDNRDD